MLRIVLYSDSFKVKNINPKQEEFLKEIITKYKDSNLVNVNKDGEYVEFEAVFSSNTTGLYQALNDLSMSYDLEII